MIGADGKGLEHLVKHLPMLRGDRNAYVELVGLLAQTGDDRREFDRLGPGAENEEYAKQGGDATCGGK